MEPIIIDVREIEEYNEGHVAGAVHIPYHEISKQRLLAEGVRPDLTVMVYCRSGNRANIARNNLVKLGYKNVLNTVSQAETERISRRI